MAQGWPPFDDSGPAVSHFEFWPPALFYFPIALMWLGLSLRYRHPFLPTAANPGLPAGGLVGESKSGVFRAAGAFANKFIAPHLAVRKNSAYGSPAQDLEVLFNKLDQAKLKYPLVAKPDLGCRGAGVRLVNSTADLEAYYRTFPSDAVFILQSFVPYEPEAGLFYQRFPDEDKGELISLTLKYFPYVIGDGEQTLEQLIHADPRAGKVAHLYLERHQKALAQVPGKGDLYKLAFAGSHSRGAIFKNGNHLITPELTQVIDRIGRDIDGFFFGRFDIRFSNIDALQRGEEFSIVEVNGAGSEATHIWDAKTQLSAAYKTLWRQYADVFHIGHLNRLRGHSPNGVGEMLRAIARENGLTQEYPTTD